MDSAHHPVRRPGPSLRVKLAASYAGVIVLAGAGILTVVWAFLLRYVPADAASTRGGFFPGRNDLLRAFIPPMAWALAALLLFALVGGWILAGRMLAPLDRIMTATRLAAQGSLSHRILMPGRQDEFRELADSFDAMLARLETHVEEQRRFAANASHELRTPLAITQTMLDVARSDPDRDVDALIERLHAINARAIGLTQALLTLSRADQGSFAREPVDLSVLAEEAAESLLPLAEARGIRVEVAGEPAETTGSQALLLQLTMNLVHNAIVHNLPEDGVVRVRTGRTPGATASGRTGAMLVVENTGEVLFPALVATLAEPFRRGTERVRSDHAGVGLGLAIVRSIARAHEGELALDARPEGGLRVTVSLPGHPAAPGTVTGGAR